MDNIPLFLMRKLENKIKDKVNIWNNFLTKKKSENKFPYDSEYCETLLKGVKEAGHSWSNNIEEGIEDWNNSTVFPIVSEVKDIFMIILKENRWNLFPLLNYFKFEYSWLDLSGINNDPYLISISTCLEEIEKEQKEKKIDDEIVTLNHLYLLYQLNKNKISEEIERIFFRELTNFFFETNINYEWKNKFDPDSFPNKFLEIISEIISFDYKKDSYLKDIHGFDVFNWTMLIRIDDAANLLHHLGFKTKEIYHITKFGDIIYKFPEKLDKIPEIYFVYYYNDNYSKQYSEKTFEIYSVGSKHEYLNLYCKFWNKMKKLEK